jgi:hypothetical protein
MAKYRVYLTRKVYQEAEIEVEAESESAAIDNAWAVVDVDPNSEFETVDEDLDWDYVEEIAS